MPEGNLVAQGCIAHKEAEPPTQCFCLPSTLFISNHIHCLLQTQKEKKKAQIDCWAVGKSDEFFGVFLNRRDGWK